MITIVNYGLGNFQAFANIYSRLNVPYKIASAPAELAGAERIVLPGVGAFDWAMTRLNSSGLRQVLDELVLERRIPILGVCVGMQVMMESSEEGLLPGLAWIRGSVKRLAHGDGREGTKLPHMGWNDVRPKGTNCLFQGIESPIFYFLHSYYVAPVSSDDVLSEADYNVTFAAAIRHDKIYGTQFHPEKSHQYGIALLKNFATLSLC